MDETDDVKKERVKNFLSIPQELESFMLLGYGICLDSFLYIFTILPIRIVIALNSMIKSFIFKTGTFNAAQRVDILKGSLLFLCSYMLEHVDASKVYHSVRGQATIKLYVIFNVLEICDKLCSAFGHDILDSLFSKAQSAAWQSRTRSQGSTKSNARQRLGRVTHFAVALCYVFAHTMILFYQVMTLNVAVNSYNNALLTLLLSNQFVEIKGSVFKRFERENLFQLSCSGGGFLVQAMIMMYDSINSFTALLAGKLGAIPFSSFASLEMQSVIDFIPQLPSALLGVLHEMFSSQNIEFLKTLLSPALAVFGTEIVVDWLKHAFITKFNQIPPTVYVKFYDSLCRDLANLRKRGSSDASDAVARAPLDQSPAVARRIGFVSLPLACLVIRVAWQTLRMISNEAGIQFFIDFTPPDAVISAIGQTLNTTVNGTAAPDGSALFSSTNGGHAWVYGFLATSEARDWLFNQVGRGFVRFLMLAVVALILLIIKVNLGLGLLNMARRRLLKAGFSSSSVQGNGSVFETPAATPVGVAPPSTAQEKYPLDEVDNTTPFVRRDVKTKDFVPGDPTVADEKLDRVDRFLMVKSRIV
ncbi:hypothetical protein HDU96_005192 [Phlyctochytrium bullatum]|nr:hypothetical protein HDU96_005192 [Phlyctochytrium bullatum]